MGSQMITSTVQLTYKVSEEEHIGLKWRLLSLLRTLAASANGYRLAAAEVSQRLAIF